MVAWLTAKLKSVKLRDREMVLLHVGSQDTITSFRRLENTSMKQQRDIQATAIGTPTACETSQGHALLFLPSLSNLDTPGRTIPYFPSLPPDIVFPRSGCPTSIKFGFNDVHKHTTKKGCCRSRFWSPHLGRFWGNRYFRSAAIFLSRAKRPLEKGLTPCRLNKPTSLGAQPISSLRNLGKSSFGYLDIVGAAPNRMRNEWGIAPSNVFICTRSARGEGIIAVL